MNLDAMLSKTAKGVEEIETRKYGLDQRTRALLIVVNGKSSVFELVEKFEHLGDITPKLERLLADGFIGEARAAAGAPAAPAAAFLEARAQLVKAMLVALGPDSDSITAKIEACSSAQELKNYLDTKRAMLEAALGRKGEPFWKKAKELLG